MQYKTIVLEFLQEQYPALHERLRASRTLLQEMERHASSLKRHHETWMDQLAVTKPDSDPIQIASAGPGTGDRGPAGRFALRVGADRRGGDAFPRRGDGLRPPTYAARVSAARARRPAPPPVRRPAWHAAHDAARLRLADALHASAVLLPPRPWPFSADVTGGAARRNRTNGFHKPCFSRRVKLPFLRLQRAPAAWPRHGGRRARLAPVWSLRKAPAAGPEPRRRRPRYGEQRDDHRHIPSSTSPAGEKAKARDILAAIRTLKTHRAGAAAGHAGRAAGARPLRRLRRRWPCRSSPTRSPAATRTPLAGPRRGAADRCSRPRNTTAPSAPPSTPSTPRPPSSRPCTRPSPASACPSDATVLEPGCGTGQFHEPGPGGHAVHRRRAGQHLRPHRPALHPEPDIRIENFRDTRLPEGASTP